VCTQSRNIWTHSVIVNTSDFSSLTFSYANQIIKNISHSSLTFSSSTQATHLYISIFTLSFSILSKHFDYLSSFLVLKSYEIFNMVYFHLKTQSQVWNCSVLCSRWLCLLGCVSWPMCNCIAPPVQKMRMKISRMLCNQCSYFDQHKNWINVKSSQS